MVTVRFWTDLASASPEVLMADTQPTWKPHEEHGDLTTRSNLPDTVFAFPRQRKEPLTDAKHVRNAIARFDQVLDVPDADRALAFANIEKAAKHYGVNLLQNQLARTRRPPEPTPLRSRSKGGRNQKAQPRRKTLRGIPTAIQPGTSMPQSRSNSSIQTQRPASPERPSSFAHAIVGPLSEVTSCPPSPCSASTP